MNTNKRQDYVNRILKGREQTPSCTHGGGWASSNIALCKYWGKRDFDLNLPMTSSLSVLLPEYGARARLQLNTERQTLRVDGKRLSPDVGPGVKIMDFLALFPGIDIYKIEVTLNFNIPVASGFAASAACYAALTKAVNQLYQWDLPTDDLSRLARLGSGSACRSFYTGFSLWEAGSSETGEDSYATAITDTMPDLCIGMCMVSDQIKAVSSTEGMIRTKETSFLYESWPKQVSHDLAKLSEAIKNNDFTALGECSEHNAMSMHATMQSAWPSINYSYAETQRLKNEVRVCREEGLEVYFTQDAGPNLKILFEKQSTDLVKVIFSGIKISEIFAKEPSS